MAISDFNAWVKYKISKYSFPTTFSKYTEWIPREWGNENAGNEVKVLKLNLT